MSSKNKSKNNGQRTRPSLPNMWGPPPRQPAPVPEASARPRLPLPRQPASAPEASARPRLPNMWGPPVRQPATAPEASARPRLPNMWGPPLRRAPLIIAPPPLVARAPPMRSTTPTLRAHRAVAESRRAQRPVAEAEPNNVEPGIFDLAPPPPPAVQRSKTPRPSSASRYGRPPPAPTRKRSRNGLPPLHPGPPILVLGPGRSGLTTRKANPNTKIVNGIALKKRNGL